MTFYKGEMFSIRVIKDIAPDIYSNDENALIDILNELEKRKLKNKYFKLCRDIYVNNNYDDAAKFVSLFRDKYVCTNITNSTVYVFSNNHWVLDHGLKYLTSDVISYNIKLANKYTMRINFIRDVVMHLYLNMFEMKLLNYKSIFMNSIVFDINKGILREGYPNDYTSLSTNCSPSNKYMNEVINILKDIFPTDDVYKYVIRFLGSLLIPGNNDKIFMVWSGTGDNGKSILMRLVELALGEYSVKLPTSTITGKRTNSSSATPDMVLIERRLVAFLQEPSEIERINIGIVKELTGNDTVYVRGMYEKGKNIPILAKLIYIVNSTENLAIIEKAIWNRIVVVPFNVTFVDKPNYPNERKKDKDLINKLRKYAPSMLQLLINEASMYIKEGLYYSSIIESNTEKVKTENNCIASYLSIPDVSTHYVDFVQYMKTFMPKESIPSLKAFNHEVHTKH